MKINNKLKKYLDLPYFLILLGIVGLIRAFILFDYNNFPTSSYDKFLSPTLLILTMIFVIKILRKKTNNNPRI
jgi:hypothetical protein